MTTGAGSPGTGTSCSGGWAESGEGGGWESERKEEAGGSERRVGSYLGAHKRSDLCSSACPLVLISPHAARWVSIILAG